jgi:hypothetical protein
MTRTHLVFSTAAVMLTARLAVPTAGAGVWETPPTDLDRAVQAAFTSDYGDNFGSLASVFETAPTFLIFSHRFSVHPVRLIERRKDEFTLGGRLILLRPAGAQGDVIAYRIVRTGSSIRNVSWQLNGGGWTSLTSRMLEPLKAYRTGRELTADQQREAGQTARAALLAAATRSWQSAVEFLIAHMALGDC